MAFRACSWAVRSSVHASRLCVSSSRHEHALFFLRTGSAAHSRRTNGPSFTPVCFITSDAFLNRLEKGKAAELDDSGYHHPSVLPGRGEQLSLLVRQPDQPETSRVLKVAIVGSPNAGKSTLSNQLLGRKVFAVSKKVHTTRSKALGVLTEDDTQIILLDTPGLTTPLKVKRHNLEESLLSDPWSTVKEADLMLVMVDVADKWTCDRLDLEVLKVLAQHPEVPAVLVLNKTDLIKNKSKLLDITAQLTCGVVNGQEVQVRRVIKPPWANPRPPVVEDASQPPTEPAPPGVRGEPSALGGEPSPAGVLSKEQLGVLKSQQGWPHFRDVFMVSSVDQEDVETLKRYLMVEAQPGPWQYHSEVLTDQTPENVCSNIVREKLLEHLHQEVPYTMTQAIEFWRENANGELDIAVKLHVKKKAHMKMVIGTAGQMVERLAREAGEDLSSIFLRRVKLRLSVKLVN